MYETDGRTTLHIIASNFCLDFSACLPLGLPLRLSSLPLHQRLSLILFSLAIIWALLLCVRLLFFQFISRFSSSAVCCFACLNSTSPFVTLIRVRITFASPLLLGYYSYSYQDSAFSGLGFCLLSLFASLFRYLFYLACARGNMFMCHNRRRRSHCHRHRCWTNCLLIEVIK